MARTEGRFWVSTCFEKEWDPSKLAPELSTNMGFLCWKAEDSSGWHQHAYAEFKKPKRGKGVTLGLGQTLQKKGDIRRLAHNELRWGTQAQAIAYVASDEYCHKCSTGDSRQAKWIFDEPYNLKKWVSEDHAECRTIVRDTIKRDDGTELLKYECELKGTVGEFQYFGTPSRGAGTRTDIAKTRQQAMDEEAAEIKAATAMAKAASDPQTAVDHLVEACPNLMARSFSSTVSMMTHASKRKFKIRPRPAACSDSNTLWQWQHQLWDYLKEDPQPRRLFWVVGDYHTGKSHMFNYIMTNYEFGAYDAGQCASLDSVVHGYEKQGVIMWDLPRCFDYSTFGSKIANVMEKFTDYDQMLSSKKYGTKTICNHAHVVIFANCEPLECLAHRNVVRLVSCPDPQPEEPPEPLRLKSHDDTTPGPEKHSSMPGRVKPENRIFDEPGCRGQLNLDDNGQIVPVWPEEPSDLPSDACSSTDVPPAKRHCPASSSSDELYWL